MTAHRIFFFSQTVRVKTVSVFQTGQFLRLLVLSSNVPLLSLFAVPNILYLNHPPLNMSYWLACVPYFRIKDAKRESDLAVLLLPLCMHIHTNTHISFLYLHTHTHTRIFFFTWWGHRHSVLNFEGMVSGRHRSNTMRLFYLRFHLFHFSLFFTRSLAGRKRPVESSG